MSEKQASIQRATQIASLIAEADSGFDTEYTHASTLSKAALMSKEDPLKGLLRDVALFYLHAGVGA